MAARGHAGDMNLLPPADLEGEIERLQAGLQDERDRTLRALADFKNYRRRIERDGMRVAGEGTRAIILPLLDIIDDMEKALDWASHEKLPFAQGVRIIYRKLLVLLEAHGVVPFECEGMPFDHERHEAVAVADPGDRDPGTVVDVLRRGYLWHNEVLRHAQVRVAG